jgi:hypothetical protein
LKKVAEVFLVAIRQLSEELTWWPSERHKKLSGLH